MVTDFDVRLLTLDLDETLWPCRPVIRAAEAALFEWLAEHAPRLVERHTQETLREHRQQLVRARPELAHDVTELRLESLRQLLLEHGHEEALARAASDLFRMHRNRVEPFAEVAEVLRRLRERFVLVSVTNGNAQVEHTPLRGLFHLSLTAGEVGAAKPDPAMFEAALAFAGVSVERCLHVGDDPHLDVEAARALGIRAAWVNRQGRAWPDELPAPDLELADLRQLEGLLA
jgi:putative hydrolase of the HAD superfamily